MAREVVTGYCWPQSVAAGEQVGLHLSSSGVPDLSITDAQRRFVEAVYHLTRAIDPSRPVISNDGWENVATDIVGIHDYDAPETLRRRYESTDVLSKLFAEQRFGARPLLAGGEAYSGQPIVLSEVGGLAVAGEGETPLAYHHVANDQELAKAYTTLLEAIRESAFFAGFCYTQLTDTYQEMNGLLRANREPKLPLEVVRDATARPHALVALREPLDRGPRTD